jgi:hypothetical protein
MGKKKKEKEERWYNLILSKERENYDKSSSLYFFFFFCTTISVAFWRGRGLFSGKRTAKHWLLMDNCKAAVDKQDIYM